MNRLLVLSLLAVAALLGGSVAVIFWGTRDEPQEANTATQTTPRADRDAPVAAYALTASTSGAPAAGTFAPSLPVPGAASSQVDAVPHGAASPQWTTARKQVHSPDGLTRSAGGSLSAATVRVRRNFRGELESGLAALQNKVAECYAGPASFTLDVESVPGGIRIVDARIENQDEANDAGIACAQQLLRGHVIDAPSVDPGKRWEIPFATRTP